MTVTRATDFSRTSNRLARRNTMNYQPGHFSFLNWEGGRDNVLSRRLLIILESGDCFSFSWYGILRPTIFFFSHVKRALSITSELTIQYCSLSLHCDMSRCFQLSKKHFSWWFRVYASSYLTVCVAEHLTQHPRIFGGQMSVTDKTPVNGVSRQLQGTEDVIVVQCCIGELDIDTWWTVL